MKSTDSVLESIEPEKEKRKDDTIIIKAEPEKKKRKLNAAVVEPELERKKDKKVKCPHCKIVVRSKSNLNRHIKEKHSMERNFLFEECGEG